MSDNLGSPWNPLVTGTYSPVKATVGAAFMAASIYAFATIGPKNEVLEQAETMHSEAQTQVALSQVSNGLQNALSCYGDGKPAETCELDTRTAQEVSALLRESIPGDLVQRMRTLESDPDSLAEVKQSVDAVYTDSLANHGALYVDNALRDEWDARRNRNTHGLTALLLAVLGAAFYLGAINTAYSTQRRMERKEFMARPA